LNSFLKWLGPRNLRIGLIAVPWLITAFYLTVIASDRYVSESIVAVREEGAGIGVPTGVDALSAMFGTSAASNEDQYMLQAHILSNDMLLQIDERLNLRQAYSSPKRDFIFRLDKDATQDQFLDYYRRRVDVIIDDASGLLTIHTQGFTDWMRSGTAFNRFRKNTASWIQPPRRRRRRGSLLSSKRCWPGMKPNSRECLPTSMTTPHKSQPCGPRSGAYANSFRRRNAAALQILAA
jgi:hypothetical protein